MMEPVIAPRPWSVKQRDPHVAFADGSAVCLIYDANDRVVAYDVGYLEAKLIVDLVNEKIPATLFGLLIRIDDTVPPNTAFLARVGRKFW